MLSLLTHLLLDLYRQVPVASPPVYHRHLRMNGLTVAIADVRTAWGIMEYRKLSVDGAKNTATSRQTYRLIAWLAASAGPAACHCWMQRQVTA